MIGTYCSANKAAERALATLIHSGDRLRDAASDRERQISQSRRGPAREIKFPAIFETKPRVRATRDSNPALNEIAALPNIDVRG